MNQQSQSVSHVTVVQTAYLDDAGHLVNRGRATSIRKRVYDLSGHLLKETLRHKISPKHAV